MRRRDLLQVGLYSLALPGCWHNAWAASDAARLNFAELYKSRTVMGMVFSERTLALAGLPVLLSGYMAPPLKPDANFFVLTRTPVAICPFCSSDADWPLDIVVVYLKNSAGFFQDGSAVSVSGILQIGSKRDPETGFVSQVRIVDASVKKL